MTRSSFLMCPPLHFGVDYVINPWMEGQVHATDADLAASQWSQLQSLLSARGDVLTLPAVAGLPDLVFTANAALIHQDVAVLSSFRFPERQPEAPYFAQWLSANGFRVHTLPPGVLFEGAGDALFDRVERLLWLGHGMRSELSAQACLEQWVDVEIQPLRLRDPRFYHLDTCFCPLERGFLLYYPFAFDEVGLDAIRARVPEKRRIELSEQDAVHFAGNAVNIGNSVILNHASDTLTEQLNACGFEVIQTALTEFMRAGGAAKCLSLRLNEA